MKVLLIMFGAVLLTNPLANQWIVVWFEQFIFLISPAAPYTMGVFALSVWTYVVILFVKSEKIKLPKKSKKSPKSGMKYELSK